MYSLGMEGEDAIIQQQTMMHHQAQNPMILGDDEEPSPRGEEHTPFISVLSSKLLRASFSLKALSFLMMALIFLGFGGRWVFTFHSHPEMSNGFHLSMVVLMVIQLFATLGLSMFQAFVADDSKWTKGFRTGSKILSAAVTLDLLSGMLRLVEYLYLYNSLSTLWWSKFNVSKNEWTLFAAANLIDSLALISYGWALFYIEIYHDEGTIEELAWGMLLFFSASGLFMLMIVFTGCGAVFMLLSTAGAYAMACYWSFMFEPLLTKWSPQLHSRDINTDIIPGDVLPPTGAYSQPQYPQAEQYVPTSTNFGQRDMNGMSLAQGVSTPIPTQYDYSQINQQVFQGIELGVMQPDQYQK